MRTPGSGAMVVNCGTDHTGTRGTPVTEQEWLSCTDPSKLIDCLLDIYQRKIDGRKEYLMSVRAVDMIWLPQMTDERSRRAD